MKSKGLFICNKHHLLCEWIVQKLTEHGSSGELHQTERDMWNYLNETNLDMIHKDIKAQAYILN